MVLVAEQAVEVFLAKVKAFFSLCFCLIFGLVALEPFLDRIDQLFHGSIFPPLIDSHKIGFLLGQFV